MLLLNNLLRKLNRYGLAGIIGVRNRINRYGLVLNFEVRERNGYESLYKSLGGEQGRGRFHSENRVRVRGQGYAQVLT